MRYYLLTEDCRKAWNFKCLIYIRINRYLMNNVFLLECTILKIASWSRNREILSSKFVVVLFLIWNNYLHIFIYIYTLVYINIYIYTYIYIYFSIYIYTIYTLYINIYILYIYIICICIYTLTKNAKGY